MAIISLAKRDDLDEDGKQFFDERLRKGKRITNMTNTLMRSMKSFYAMEFYPIRDEMIKIVGNRATYFYCYAISAQTDCLVCSTYHAKLLRDLNIRPDEFKNTEIEKILIAYGRAIVDDANNVPEKLYVQLKDIFTDKELVIITTVGCKMIASNLFNQALKVDLDEYLYDVDFKADLQTK
ncbi:hypothetical protein FC89_GL001079 [Liquorilactobacillus ghanensis DSM 18630]|uniref:Carboxymuconolactone decarboxylase-like domain-containing protein n=2 Tax=Liquorilactobacillus ghanensis TaxID=399370 RepID=A0A0R1VKP6_9LACO|nr:hypothetical protein FC89_GL001079 [Liquorilactobacillus ghanensis DSM 18630]